jgi:xanthine dehydrogenase large subunit
LPPNTAFRGFGAPQGIFTIECVMDKIAEQLDLDYVAVREANLYQEGQLTPYGQTVHEPYHPELFVKLKEKSQYQQLLADTTKFNRENQYLKRGLAVTPVKFGISFTFTPLNQGSALIWIYTDGTIALSHGGIEMGQEINTKVVQVVAAELGVKLNRIRVESSNTLRNGNASPTAASSGADINCNAALDAARQLKARLHEAAVKLFAEKGGVQVKIADVVFEDDKIYSAKHPEITLDFAELISYAYVQRINLGAQGYYKTPDVHFDRTAMQGSPFYYYVQGVALVQVEVDVLTGVNKLLKVYIVHEMARSINLDVDLGQISGAFFQGFGYSTMEEMCFNEKGSYLANVLATYKIPVIKNLPEVFEVEVCERDCKYSSAKGSKAIGEPPLIYGEAAYFAIKHALADINLHQDPNSKLRVDLAMPATPEAVLKAIK